MIQLTRDGVFCSEDLEPLAHQFKREYFFRLPRLLHPELLSIISTRLVRSGWKSCQHEDIGKEVAPADRGVVHLLNFIANAREFIDLIHRITQCAEISRFGGRVYRMVPDSEHADSWHSDITTAGDRLVGMSMNLSSRPHLGGVFELRDETTGKRLLALPNTGLGDAIFFKISPNLTHRVTPMEGTEAKTAFAGWFMSGESGYYSTLRERTSTKLGPGAPVVS